MNLNSENKIPASKVIRHMQTRLSDQQGHSTVLPKKILGDLDKIIAHMRCRLEPQSQPCCRNAC